MRIRSAFTLIVLLGAQAGPIDAQAPSPSPSQPAAIATTPATGPPGVVTQGSTGVSIGGLPAARKGDANDQGNAIVGGSPNVFINGRPAATVGDKTGCGGVVITGKSNVFINGKPAATSGSLTTDCEKK